MHGPGIIARSISAWAKRDRYGNSWQYNSRSDHHSKVACWAILFDLLLTSKKLREQAGSGDIAFGINHEMRDFRNDKPKSLDLVICTPGAGWSKKKPRRTVGQLANDLSIVLDESERTALASLPAFRENSVGAVRLALEAKACMTAHVAALPRLHDELSSSHHTIHGASDSAVAVGLVMINMATEFHSTVRNSAPLNGNAPQITRHDQPRAVRVVLEKIKDLPRRTRGGKDGYDALGVVVVDCRNDGSPVKSITVDPAPAQGSSYHYDELVHRAVQAYETRFGS